MTGFKDPGLVYVQELGFRTARNQRAAEANLQRRVGMKKARECLDWLRARPVSSHNERMNEMKALYSKKNEALDLSLAISEMFDADYIRKMCNHIAEHIECFGKTILDVGCDNGIITCFIARLCPEARITGIDRCEESICSARQLAQKLGVSNVEFVRASIESYSGGQFDTVLESRVIQENISDPEISVFDTFYNISLQYKNVVAPYMRSLLQHVKENGHIILGHLGDFIPSNMGDLLYLSEMQIEPVDNRVLYFSCMGVQQSIQVLNWKNTTYTKCQIPDQLSEELQTINNSSFLNPYLKDNHFLARLIFVSEMEDANVQLNDGLYFGWNANLLFEENAGTLICGYHIYLKDQDKPNMYSLWNNAKDKTAVFYFGASHMFSDKQDFPQCWANMDISVCEEKQQIIRKMIMNSAEVGLIEKICALSVDQDGHIVEKVISLDEVKGEDETPYHDLQSSGGLADFLKDNL